MDPLLVLQRRLLALPLGAHLRLIFNRRKGGSRKGVRQLGAQGGRRNGRERERGLGLIYLVCRRHRRRCRRRRGRGGGGEEGRLHGGLCVSAAHSVGRVLLLWSDEGWAGLDNTASLHGLSRVRVGLDYK